MVKSPTRPKCFAVLLCKIYMLENSNTLHVVFVLIKVVTVATRLDFNVVTLH